MKYQSQGGFMKKQKSKGHIHDRDDLKKNESYQTRNIKRDDDLATTASHPFKREALGFTDRDTRGYDRFNKGKY
jgi:hypothetical protein